MKEKVNIIFKEYDDENFFVLLKRNSVNLYMDFGLCDFINEMEHWGMPTKLVVFMGEPGFLFSNEIDKLDVKNEIGRFIIHNDI